MEKERAQNREWRKELKQNTSKYNEYKENERFRILLNKQKTQKDQEKTRQGLVNPVDTANESSSSLPKTLSSVLS